jgi:MFS family permease
MSAFSPLKQRTFAALWLAAVVSNIGTWMHEVGAGWLMTELTSDPMMISLVAASTSLPVFLFVYLSGALADILDRRKFLLVAQGFMLVVAATLAYLTWDGQMNPWLLLVFTFAIGTGAAFVMPAWDAIIPELVPKQDLQQAVALGSVGMNVARAVGPAIAGLVIAQFGTYAVFAINTVSFVGVILALALWNREAPKQGMAPERFVGALKSGVRFVSNTKPLRFVLVRSALFFIPAIALLSLLPLYVRQVLQADAQVLGYLQGAMGIGAIVTAFLLPMFKKRVSIDSLLLVAALMIAATYALLGWAPGVLTGLTALFIAGAAWITAFSLLRVAAQQTVPNWVRARAMAVTMMTGFGAMALGSAVWGKTAVVLGLMTTYNIAAGTAILLALLGLPFALKGIGKVDHSPAGDFSHHDALEFTPSDDQGPVMVEICYPVSQERLPNFLALVAKLRDIRQRNGGYRWALFNDLEDTSIYIETFLVENWQEHERQHGRTGESEKAVHDAVFSCLDDGQKPRIRHWIHTPLEDRK